MAGGGVAPRRAMQKVAFERERIAVKRAAQTRWLGQFIKTLLPDVAIDPAQLTGLLRVIHAAGSAVLTAAERTALRAALVERLGTQFSELKIGPKDFGLADVGQVADLFVRMLEQAEYSGYPVARLRSQARGRYSRTPGLRSIFAGRLLELFVRHHVALQQDLRTMAEAQLADLRGVVDGTITGRPPLLDGDGKPITLNGEFGPVRQAVDIWTVEPDGRQQFIDAALVSVFTPTGGGPARLVVLVETEIKLPGSARDFPEQIDAALGRFSDADAIQLRFVDRATPTTFGRDQLIVDVTTMQRVAIRPSAGGTGTYAFRDITRGGFEPYLKVGLAVDVDKLYQLVNTIFSLAR